MQCRCDPLPCQRPLVDTKSASAPIGFLAAIERWQRLHLLRARLIGRAVDAGFAPRTRAGEGCKE